MTESIVTVVHVILESSLLCSIQQVISLTISHQKQLKICQNNYSKKMFSIFIYYEADDGWINSFFLSFFPSFLPGFLRYNHSSVS